MSAKENKMRTREDKIKKKKEIISIVRESGLEEKNEIEDSLNGTSRIFKEVETYLTMSGLGETWVLFGKVLVNYKNWNLKGLNNGSFFNSKENYFIVKVSEDLEKFKKANDAIKEKLEEEVVAEEDLYQKKAYEIINEFPMLDSKDFISLISRFLKAQEAEKNLDMANIIWELDEKIARSKLEISKKELDDKLGLKKDKKTRLKERKVIFDKIKGDEKLEIAVRELSDNKIKEFSKLNKSELIAKLK